MYSASEVDPIVHNNRAESSGDPFEHDPPLCGPELSFNRNTSERRPALPEIFFSTDLETQPEATLPGADNAIFKSNLIYARRTK